MAFGFGFDTGGDRISHCTDKFSSKYSNFNFQKVDIYNKFYSPGGRIEANSFEFPFEHNIFDSVYLTSVFMHVQKSVLEKYIPEIARVLKSNGKCFIAYYLLNQSSMIRTKNKKSTLGFQEIVEVNAVVDKATPELQIAYNKNYIFDLYEKVGLKIELPVFYGTWPGREIEECLTYQDVVIARKN